MALWFLLTSIALVALTAARSPNIKTLTPHGVEDDHIVSGQVAKPAQFPHQALIIINDASVCGGSLISLDFVLTAAHCVGACPSCQKFSIRLGGIHRIKFEDTAWTVLSAQAEAHPKYNESGYLNNDIAVIFLPSKPPVSRYIKVVELPNFEDVDNTFEGHNATVSGWGYTSGWGNSSCSEVLRWTEMTVIANRYCKWHYQPGAIVESTLCAVSIHSSTCSGDSGTALVINTPHGYKQIGVLSFGPPHCLINVPSGFARVTSFLRWIKETAGIVQ